MLGRTKFMQPPPKKKPSLILELIGSGLAKEQAKSSKIILGSLCNCCFSYPSLYLTWKLLNIDHRLQ